MQQTQTLEEVQQEYFKTVKKGDFSKALELLADIAKLKSAQETA